MLRRSLLSAFAAALILPSQGSAADLTLSWLNPCSNTMPDSCVAAEDTLRDLSHIRFRLVRFTNLADTLVLDVPEVGRECDSSMVTFDIDPGSMGVAEARTVDYYGNESCGLASYLFAIPAQEVFPGLDGAYYDNSDLTGLKLTRADPAIDFDWDSSAPAPGMGSETFSIVWTGFLTPALTGQYQFFARVEDGVKLWVGPTWVISDWGVNNEHESSGFAQLVGGTRYTLRMEYMANNGTAMARLSWLPPGGVKAVIPAEAFTR